MPLSEREKVIIATTVTGYISNIFLESLEDFLLLPLALRSLLLPEQKDCIDNKFQHNISLIHDYMEPWFGAVTPENREEFIALCKTIILNRIEYFEGLSDIEKNRYICEQVNYKQEISENQAKMRSATPPEEGFESHVISEQEMIRQMQETGDPQEFNMTFLPEPVPQTDPSFYTQNPRTFFSPYPSAITEQVHFNNWTMTNDTRTHGYDATPYEHTAHPNRERTYKNNDGQCIEQISIHGLTDDSYSVSLLTSWDWMIRQQFIEALHNADIHQTTPGVRVYPGSTSPNFIISVTSDTVHDILGKIFSVIDTLEGEESINELMKSELIQSLEQFISPTPSIR